MNGIKQRYTIQKIKILNSVSNYIFDNFVHEYNDMI
jgi:hypothetical protein